METEERDLLGGQGSCPGGSENRQQEWLPEAHLGLSTGTWGRSIGYNTDKPSKPPALLGVHSSSVSCGLVTLAKFHRALRVAVSHCHGDHSRWLLVAHFMTRGPSCSSSLLPVALRWSGTKPRGQCHPHCHLCLPPSPFFLHVCLSEILSLSLRLSLPDFLFLPPSPLWSQMSLALIHPVPLYVFCSLLSSVSDAPVASLPLCLYGCGMTLSGKPGSGCRLCPVGQAWPFPPHFSITPPSSPCPFPTTVPPALSLSVCLGHKLGRIHTRTVTR